MTFGPAWGTQSRHSHSHVVPVVSSWLILFNHKGTTGTTRWNEFDHHGAVNHEVSRALAMVQSDDPTAATHGLAVLKRLSVFADFDPLVTQYESEEDQGRRARLARVYRELTGKDIEHRLAGLRD